MKLDILKKGEVRLNKTIQQLIGEFVQLELSGKKFMNGSVIELGSDVVVLFNGKDYIYIPLIHIKNIKIINKDELEINIIEPKESPVIGPEQNFSLRKALTMAKGMYLEIYVANDEPLHGYVTSIMNNYFVFYSPIYKTMYITLHHLKWLIPYSNSQKPYDFGGHSVQSANQITLARSFEIQVEKLKNELVMFNIGENKNMIGKINNVEDNFVELQLAREKPILLNLHHIKTVHKV